jgi:hypothetical protein
MGLLNCRSELVVIFMRASRSMLAIAERSLSRSL